MKPFSTRSSRALVLAGALAMVAGIGLSGGIITVHPAAIGGVYADHAAAYSEQAGTYLSATILRVGPDANYSYSYSLRVAVIDPSTGMAGTPTILDSTSRFMTDPAVAWNPSRNRYLVTWAVGDDLGYLQVHAIIVDAAGHPVGGPAGFTLSAETWVNQRKTKVACDGRDWMVVWAGARQEGSQYAQLLRGRRVGGAGTNAAPDLGSPIFDIAATDTGESFIALELAFGSGLDYLAVWQQSDPSGSIVQGCTLSPSGSAGLVRRYDLDPNQEDDSIVRDGLALTATDDGFLVGWGGQANPSPWYCLKALQLSDQGAPLGQPMMVRNPPVDSRNIVDIKTVRFAWNRPAEQCFAIWTELVPGGSSTLLGGRVYASGQGAEEAIPLLDQNLNPGNNIPLSLATPFNSDSKVLFQWSDGGVKARFYDLAGIVAPAAPVGSQYRLDGATPIPPGAETNQLGFEVHSPASGNAVALDVEVARAGVAFTGVPTQGVRATDGSTLTVQVMFPDFALGRTYHWQLRSVDVSGRTSRWVSQGTDPDDPSEVDIAIRATNEAPTISLPGQSRASDGSAIATGFKLSGESTLVFRAVAADPDADDLRIEVEARPVGEPFRGEPIASGSWTSGGAPVAVAFDFPGADKGGAYHWQARVVDSLGGASNWMSFGENAEGSADFEFLARGSFDSGVCLNSAAGAGATPAFMAWAAIVAWMLRKRGW